ncbi:MAG: hypothetical protein M2R45_02903 [Verrucomicrobia subdivision 3 bacterium]|nr:hypothetical protein [Limisphaerales bacterium]MCS1414755.1 hypothetical protein [Limisphaerales bacterium]
MASRPQRKKRHLIAQAVEQKELSGPIAEAIREEIKAAVRDLLPRVIQSVSVQEQSLHIGPLPPADEAEKYQKLCPDFVDRMLAITERAQKADASVQKRAQWFQFIHKMAGLLITGGIVLGTFWWSYRMFIADHGIFESLSPFLGTVAVLAGIFYGAKKLDAGSRQGKSPKA